MNNKSLGYIATTNETYYANDSGEAVEINIHVCNTHTASINVTLSISSLTQGLSRGSGVPIFKDDLLAGETVCITDVVVNHKQNLMGLSGTADKVTIKVDEV